MRPLFLLFALLLHVQKTHKSVVYICDSPKAKKYHLRNDCRGLSNCTHKIIEISLEEAKKRKLELCKLD
ncbi:hypothetical protein ABIC74_004903 [Mucilaginibacter rubeus]